MGARPPTDKRAIQNRLRRVAGQVAGLQKMVQEDRYCIDVLTQLAAIRSALDALGVQLLIDHMDHCVAGAGTNSAHRSARKRSQRELLEEMRLTLSRFLR